MKSTSCATTSIFKKMKKRIQNRVFLPSKRAGPRNCFTFQCTCDIGVCTELLISYCGLRFKKLKSASGNKELSEGSCCAVSQCPHGQRGARCLDVPPAGCLPSDRVVLPSCEICLQLDHTSLRVSYNFLSPARTWFVKCCVLAGSQPPLQRAWQRAPARQGVQRITVNVSEKVK